MKVLIYSQSKYWVILFLSILSSILFLSCEEETTLESYTKIDRFYPPAGEVGTTVTILGELFGSSKSAVDVTFGEFEAEVQSVFPEEIKAIVPEGASTAKISVTINGTTVTSIDQFSVEFYGPILKEFYPLSGPVGSSITIVGENFSEVPEENMVLLGTVEATVLKAEGKALKVEVPEGAETAPIHVTIDNRTAVTEESFVVTPTEDPVLPVSISGFAPQSGDFETEVVIDGENFSEIPDENEVLFGNVMAEVIEASESQLTVIAPNGANTSKIQVTVNNSNAISDDYFMYPVWKKLKDFDGGERRRAMAFVADGVAFVGSGRDGDNLDTYDIWSYDFQNDTWSEMSTAYPGTGSVYNGTLVIDDVPFVLDGFGQGVYSGVFRSYDTNTDAWTTQANFAQSQRNRAATFSLDNKGYICAGGENGLSYNDLWEYDPVQNEWTKKEDLGNGTAQARYQPSSYVLDGEAYVGLGRTDTEPLSDFFKYDGTTWTTLMDFPGGARYGAVSFVIDGKAYVGTGDDLSNSYDDIWVYDATTDTWSETVSYPGVARSGAVSFVINGKAYIGLGEDTDKNPLSDFYVFDPANILME